MCDATPFASAAPAADDRAPLNTVASFDVPHLDPSLVSEKMEEVYAFEHAPHPIEFKMYYSV